jgi:hypothetical protein
VQEYSPEPLNKEISKKLDTLIEQFTEEAEAKYLNKK